jgi:arabinose-5-phosphate isomerase
MHGRPTIARSHEQELSFAKRIIADESAALVRLSERLDTEFSRAIDAFERCTNSGGSVLVSGLGKSGIIGQKIAATLSSLGVASHFVHPAEAAHGDLGRFRANDVAICISNSGETDEVVNLAAILRQDEVPIVAVVGRTPREGAASSLERLATITLRLHLTHEAGEPDFTAPTSSTTATLALGDAIALSLARRREFTEADFAKRHPGGTLGGMLRGVMDIIRFRAQPPESNLPLIADSVTVAEALRVAAKAGRRPGALLLVAGDGTLSGIFTDGDLRRLILRNPAELEAPIGTLMTRSPRTLRDSALVRDAVTLFRECRQDEIPIVDDAGRPVGLLDVQDLIALKLVR